MEFVLYMLIAIVAFWAGWHIRAISILANMARNPEHMIKVLKQIQELNEQELVESAPTATADQEGTELKIERVGNMLYAYDKDSGEFIAQGPDLQTLLDTANKRFPNDRFFGYIPNTSSAKELAVKN